MELSYSTVEPHDSKQIRDNSHAKKLLVSPNEILKSLWDVLLGAFSSVQLARAPWRLRHNLVYISFGHPEESQQQGRPYISSATLQFKTTAEAKKFRALFNRERGELLNHERGTLALLKGFYAMLLERDA